MIPKFYLFPLCILLLSACSVAVSGPTISSMPPSSPLSYEKYTYENPDAGFRISLPVGSQEAATNKDTGMVTRFFLPDGKTLQNNTENIGFYVSSFDIKNAQNKSTPGVWSLIKQKSLQNKDFIRTKITTLSGIEGIEMKYTSKINNQESNEMDFVFGKDGVIYVLNYFPVVDENIEMIRNIAQSFDFSSSELTGGSGENTQTVKTDTKKNSPNNNFMTYVNKTYNMSMQYPPLWKQSEEQIGNGMGILATFMAPLEDDEDYFGENLTIIVQDITAQPMTMNEFTKFSLDQLKQGITNFKIIESSPLVLDGKDGHKVVYTGTMGAYTLQWLQIWTVQNNKVFNITYTAIDDKYKNYLDTIQIMIDSFQFL